MDSLIINWLNEVLLGCWLIVVDRLIDFPPIRRLRMIGRGGRQEAGEVVSGRDI